MVLTLVMSLSICAPPVVTNMSTHLYTCRKTVSNQTSLFIGLKIITDKTILKDEYLNAHENS